MLQFAYNECDALLSVITDDIYDILQLLEDGKSEQAEIRSEQSIKDARIVYNNIPFCTTNDEFNLIERELIERGINLLFYLVIEYRPGQELLVREEANDFIGEVNEYFESLKDVPRELSDIELEPQSESETYDNPYTINVY